MLCFFPVKDWEERYINENYTHIMQDKLIETVSNTTHTHTHIASTQSGLLIFLRISAASLSSSISTSSPAQMSTGSQSSPTWPVTTWWRRWSTLGSGPEGPTK